ncbi:hypothetical protein T439DRAFT_326689 [Meredithblackwellia eburnea MCA 4105]
MGGSRWFAWSLDGIAKQQNVHIVTFDRPSSGGSTPCPLSNRVEWTFYAILAILKDLPSKPASFHVLSHSNGILYALHLLLHLPPEYKVLSWLMTSPYVPPWLSGNVPLSLARWIPPVATGQLGVLVSGVLRTFGPINSWPSWSTGFAKAGIAVSGGISGWVSGGGGTETAGSATSGSTTTEAPKDPPEMERARFVYRNAARPAHKRLYGRYYYSEECVRLVQQWTILEGADAYGPEALISFRVGEGGANWGWGTAEGELDDQSQLYERGFQSLRAKFGDSLTIKVYFGADDGLIPLKGRSYLKRLLGEQELLKEGDWFEIEEAGHDEILGLELVVDSILETVTGLSH